MHYPWWYVPVMTSPMVIALIAVLHVVVSHYAVGGGLLLARENSFAHKKKDESYRNYWKKHLHFFVLLTVVYGAITGVGIWWTIGLASPLATEFLIRTFVFGWAIEWVFFIIEIIAAFLFYYYWNKLPGKQHTEIGWIYALSAWISLVLITGITAFMLNSSSLFGNPEGDRIASFWHAFFNKQFLPQTIIRTGGALVLATFYIYFHAAWAETNENIREQVIVRMRRPSLLGVLLMVIGFPLWFWMLPESSRMLLERAPALNLLVALFGAITVACFLLIWLGPIRAPKKMNIAQGASLLLLGFAAVASAEFIREAVRKPFIVDQLVYGNQILTNEVRALREKGYLESGIWTRLVLQSYQNKYPQLRLVSDRVKEETALIGAVLPKQDSKKIRQTQFSLDLSKVQGDSAQFREIPNRDGVEPIPLGKSGSSQPSLTPTEKTVQKPERAQRPTMTGVQILEDRFVYGNAALLQMSPDDQLAIGRVIFMYHCNDCHAAKRGYSAVAPLLTGKNKDEIVHFLLNLNRPTFCMPPWCGTQVEAELLTQYLLSIRPEMPGNIVPKKKEEPKPQP